MLFSSPTQSTLTRDVARYNDGLRREFTNLPDRDRESAERAFTANHEIAALLDAQIPTFRSAGRSRTRRPNSIPARVKAIAAATRARYSTRSSERRRT